MIDLPLTQLATEVLTIYGATWQLNKMDLQDKQIY